MSRNRALVRVLRLMQLLKERSWTFQELSCELRVSTRTIRRDMEALQEAHIAVVYDPDRGRDKSLSIASRA